MLVIAMITGVVAHNIIHLVAFISPYLIFIMLLITFCRIDPSEFKVTRFIWIMLAFQIIGAIIAYLAIVPFSADVAQGAFICIFCPTATAAPVVTGMLGGSITMVAAYSLISNVSVALLAPVLFAWIGAGHSMMFADACLTISSHVFPLICAPLALALLFRAWAPKVHSMIAGHQSLSFYLWAVALIIVVGNAVSFIISEPVDRIPEMLCIAAVSLCMCVLQFYAGRRIGLRFSDRIAGAQGLGQKNTVLAIWMALTYLDPIASVGPAAYVAWQNIINSAQLYHRLHSNPR